MSEKESNLIEYSFLGNTGLKVFPLCLGTMPFAYPEDKHEFWSSRGMLSQPEDFEKIFLEYHKNGGNFIDTSCNYQQGGSELAIGKMIKKFNINRNDLVLATKYTASTSPINPNLVGNNKKNLRISVEESLKRLNTDYIDILYVHFWTWDTCSEQVLRSLNDLIRTGKILHIGLSDSPAWQLSKMNQMAKYLGLDPFVVYQGEYSLIERSIEQEIFTCCKDSGVCVAPWGTVGGGRLKGVVQQKDIKRGSYKIIKERDVKVQQELEKIAKKHNVSPAIVAQRWCLDHKQVPSIIIGPRKYEHFSDSLKVLKFQMTLEERKSLNEVSNDCPEKIFPYKYIGTKNEESKWQFPLGKKWKVSTQF